VNLSKIVFDGVLIMRRVWVIFFEKYYLFEKKIVRKKMIFFQKKSSVEIFSVKMRFSR
jgi:hypothetical protein